MVTVIFWNALVAVEVTIVSLWIITVRVVVLGVVIVRVVTYLVVVHFPRLKIISRGRIAKFTPVMSLNSRGKSFRHKMTYTAHGLRSLILRGCVPRRDPKATILRVIVWRECSKAAMACAVGDGTEKLDANAAVVAADVSAVATAWA